MVVDRETNQLFVADGCGNKRVIVFDATTGAYKRHWGAYVFPDKPEFIATPYGRFWHRTGIGCDAA
jgi:hypothetical protein